MLTVTTHEGMFYGKVYVFLTYTRKPVLRGFVSGVTGTLVASDHVNTLAVFTEPVTQFTLVNVCGTNKHILLDIFHHAPPHLVKHLREDGGHCL